MTKEIPINCSICEYLIQDYDNGEFICSWDEFNPVLLPLGECSEFKIGKINLVEFLEKMKNKIESIESENKLLKTIIKEKIEYAIEINEVLTDSEGYNEFTDNYMKKQENWLKQLEGK